MPTRLAVLAFAIVVSASGGPARGAPAARVPVVVELFTSEGCSSCPPADTVLIDLLRDQPVPGVEIIGLSEHVDYWDELGWKDRFSNAAFTRRQNAYASALHLGEVYTPQIVVDGAAALVGSDRAAALSAIARAAAAPKQPITLAWTTSTPPALEVTLAAAPRTADAILMLAIVEDGLTSAVTRGENAGRQLAHGGVTRVLTRIGTASHDGAFHFAAPVNFAVAWNRAAARIVVFAQHGDSGLMLAAGAIPAIGAK